MKQHGKVLLSVGVILLFGFMPFAIFLNLNIDEEPTMVMNEEFNTDGIESTNGIQDIVDMRNIGWGYSDYWEQEVNWWVEVIPSLTTMILNVYSSPDKTTIANLEYTQTSTAPGTDGATTVPVIDSILTRVYGNERYVSYSFRYDYGASSTRIGFFAYYSTNDGTTWTLGAGTASSGTEIVVIDFIKVDTNLARLLWVRDDTTQGKMYVRKMDNNNAGSQLNYDWDIVYAGIPRPNTDIYVFVAKNTGGNWAIWEYDYSAETFTEVSTISITEPTTFTPKYQQYWKQSDMELLLDPYYMRIRPPNQTGWTETPATTPGQPFTLIWSLDQLRIEYIVWDNTLWKWVEGGAIGAIQQLSPRDYKYIWPTASVVPGVQQWGTFLQPDLSAWDTTGTGADCEVLIEEVIDGHQNVMALDDQNLVTFAESEIDFTSVTTSGVYEFWTRTTDTGNQQIYFLTGAQTSLYFRIRSDKIQYHHTGTYFDATNGAVADNTWYKIKIVFDITNHVYEFYLDDVLLDSGVPFNNLTETRIDHAIYRTDGTFANYTMYIDGVAWSADGYLPPGAGEEYDLSQWTDSSGTGCTVTINGEVDGHTDVMELDDQSAGNQCNMVLTLADITSGEWEFFARNSDATRNLEIFLYDGSFSHGLLLYMRADEWQYYDGSSFNPIVAAANDIWYKIKIIFDLSGTWSIFIDDIEYGPYTYRGTPTTIDNLRIATNTTNIHICYIDDLRFSWETYTNADIAAITAVVGHLNWFSTGTITYEKTWAAYSTDVCDVDTAIYQIPAASIQSFTPPVINQYVILANDNEVQFYEGFIEKYEWNSEKYKYQMRHGLVGDWQVQKIDATYRNMTLQAIMKAAIDDYGSFTWYGRGTNGDVTEFIDDIVDGTESGWANTDDANTFSTSVQKTLYNSYSLKNEIFKNILQQYDNSAVGNCFLTETLTGDKRVFSFWMGTDLINANTNLIKNWYEGANRIGYFTIRSNNLVFVGSGSNNIIAAVINTMYHVSILFNAAGDSAAVYINGEKINDYALQNNITTAIDKQEWNTSTANSGYKGFYQDAYKGNSLAAAFQTLDSISPLPTTTYTTTFKGKTMLDVFKWADKQAGYITSVRPNNQVYWDQFSPSALTVDPEVAPGISKDTPIQVQTTKYSKVTVYGGYVDGVQLKSEAYGEANYAPWSDWESHILNQTILDAFVAQIVADKNVEVKKLQLGVTYPVAAYTQGMIYYGTDFTFNYTRYGVVSDLWYFLSVKYDGIMNRSDFVGSDSYQSPASQEYTSPEARVDTVDRKTVQNEQNIGHQAEYTVVNAENKEATGWLVKPTISVATNTFTVTAPYEFFQNGLKYVYTADDGDATVDLSSLSTYDIIFVYFKADRTLFATTTPWTFGQGFVFTALVYKQAAEYIIFDERHGLMPWQSHREMHEAFGALYARGFDATPSSTDCDYTEGEFYDEDNEHIMAAGAPKNHRVLYASAAGHTNWIVDTATTRWHKDGGGNIYYDNNGSLTALTNNRWTNYWIFMNPDQDDVVYSLMGQAQYNQEVNALLADPGALVTPDFFIEFRLAWQFTVKSDGTYGSAVDWRKSGRGTSGSSNTTSHNSLSGRAEPDSHPMAAITHLEQTLANGATTIDLANGTVAYTSTNSTPTAITNLTNARTGQVIIIIGGSVTNSSTIADSSPFYLTGAWTAGLNDTLMLYIKDATNFIELSRSNN